jgi:hypothetical protein
MVVHVEIRSREVGESGPAPLASSARCAFFLDGSSVLAGTQSFVARDEHAAQAALPHRLEPEQVALDCGMKEVGKIRAPENRPEAIALIGIL